jgi:hypothetical protein
MSMPMPPQLEAAETQLTQLFSSLEGKSVNVAQASWAELEKSAIKVFKGKFDLAVAEHQLVALGFAASLGRRLHESSQAFWFPHRETPEGASLGFPEALIMLSPLGAVMDALASAKLEKLDEVVKDIRTSLAQAKFSGAATQKLGPEDYMRLFDPSFVQLVGIDTQKAQKTWNTPPERLSIDLRDAISRASKLPNELKKQLEQQLLGALARMEVGKPILSQVPRAPRVVETMGLLFATTQATGAAAEEFFSDVVMPLLFVGAPTQFPPLGEEELEAAKQGVDPLFLFLESVPYQFSAPDEEGLLGAFPGDSLALPDEAFSQVRQVRLIKVGTAAIAEPLKHFDEAKTRAAVKRFGELVASSTGSAAAPSRGAEEAKMMLDAAMSVLSDLKAVVKPGTDLYMRRMTEAEASSEPALALVRQALQGPRIIL